MDQSIFVYFFYEKCRKIINTSLIFMIVCFYDRKQNRFHGIKDLMILCILLPDLTGQQNLKLNSKKLGTLWVPVLQFNHWKMMFASVTCKEFFLFVFVCFFYEKCWKIINTALIFMIVCFYDRKQNRFDGIQEWMILWILLPYSRRVSRNVH